MEMGFFGCYLIIINVIGFLLFAVSTSLYSHMTDKQVDAALTITALLGSSVGNLLLILRLDRKAKKENMMLRVFIASVFVIWIMIFLMLKGYIADFVYHDHWTSDGDYMYSGEGKTGDQQMTLGNKAIVDAECDGKLIHLFVKFSPQEYYYQGIFSLMDYTYEDDKDESGNVRKEYKFRLRKKSEEE